VSDLAEKYGKLLDQCLVSAVVQGHVSTRQGYGVEDVPMVFADVAERCRRAEHLVEVLSEANTGLLRRMDELTGRLLKAQQPRVTDPACPVVGYAADTVPVWYSETGEDMLPEYRVPLVRQADHLASVEALQGRAPAGAARPDSEASGEILA
jgi:hypothetical protein